MHNYDAQQHRAGQIISPLTLQTITIAQTLSVGGEGKSKEGTRELLDTIKARKLAYSGHSIRKQGSCLEKEIMQGTSQVHAGKEDHTRPGWTTSIHGQNSPRKSQSE